MAKGGKPAGNGRETFRQARHFMMERSPMGMLKCRVTENFVEVFVFIGKFIGWADWPGSWRRWLCFKPLL